MLDQNLALKWIHENAERFGGDPKRITIGGESAGSWSVGYHLVYKKSWPYFTNAILQSGSPFTPDIGTQFLTQGQANAISLKIGNLLGCSRNLLDCLQTISASAINLASYAYQSYPTFVFTPDVFDKEPKQLFQMGQFKKCNILSGYNNFEEISLAENEIGNEQIKDLRKNVSDSLQRAVKKRLSTDDTTANEIINFYSNRSNLDDCYMLFVKIITDHQYKCPTYELAKYYAQLNQSAYVYEYGHKLSVSENKPRVNGASHAEEIPILFAQPLFDHSYFTEAENLFSQRLVRYWGSFVSDGVPSLTDWPDFNGTSVNLNRNVLFLKSDNITNMIYLENDSVCKFWNNLSIAYVASQCGTIGVSFFLCFFLVILAIQTNRIE